MRKLSVVITTFNSLRTIGKCLEAVKWADEIIVVDSGSTDGTIDICQKYPNCRIIQNPSPYTNIKRNYGYEQASGDWILTLDSDEIVPPELSEEIRGILSSDNIRYDGYLASGRELIFGKRRGVERKEAKLTDRQIFSLFRCKPITEQGIFKVLYIDEWSDIHGGGQIYLLDLLKRINRNRFIPFFVCPSTGKFVDALERIGVRTEIIKMKRLINPLNIFSFIFSTIKIILLIKRERINLIHSNAAARGTIYSGIAAKIMKIPLIWHVHIINSAGWIDRILVALSTKMIFVAGAVRKRFRWSNDESKFIINYNGIELEKFNPNIDRMGIRKELGLGQDIPLVGTIGILHSQKGQKYLLKAAEKVKKEIPNVKFLIVGEDTDEKKSYRIELENLMETLELSENVIFTGWRQDIPEVLAGLDLFVLPSLTDLLPLVVLEAMASRKAVVATDVGGVSEMVEDGVTGILIPPGDAKSLSKAIMDLLKNRERAKEMGLAGRRRVEEFFSIGANAKRIEQIYNGLLEKKF